MTKKNKRADAPLQWRKSVKAAIFTYMVTFGTAFMTLLPAVTKTGAPTA